MTRRTPAAQPSADKTSSSKKADNAAGAGDAATQPSAPESSGPGGAQTDKRKRTRSRTRNKSSRAKKHGSNSLEAAEDQESAIPSAAAEPVDVSAFAQLGLDGPILEGIQILGFSTPTPIQQQAIPVMLEGRDVVASAQTGTGKTAAFSLPMLQVIARQAASGHNGEETGDTSADPRALVITPTRELATQIDRVVKTVAQKLGQQVVTLIGGKRYDTQVKALKRGCDVLVATPGRLIDLLDQGLVSLDSISFLVLDEADRMLDMGFWPSVRKIVSRVPKERQTALFSATITRDIEQTTSTMMHDPMSIAVSFEGQTAETIEERLVPVNQSQKPQLLLWLLQHAGKQAQPADSGQQAQQAQPAGPDAAGSGNDAHRTLVFCRTKSRVDGLTSMLEREGISVGAMHADLQQRQRERALRDFRAGEIAVLIATDVMSRGIDVQGIDQVVNFDVPMDPHDYVHRIGRTGRAGVPGLAFTFVAPDEISPLREIEHFTKSVVPVWEPPGFDFDAGRIVPQASRNATRTTRSLFSGSRSRGRGISGGRFGRHV